MTYRKGGSAANLSCCAYEFIDGIAGAYRNDRSSILRSVAERTTQEK
jgi:hypothetical protein